MSFSFIRTAIRVRKPLTYFSALAAMSLTTSLATADDEAVTPPKANVLNQLFTAEEKYEFSAVPQLEDRLDVQVRNEALRLSLIHI